MKENTNLFLLFKEFPGQDGRGIWMFRYEDENLRKNDVISKYSIGGCTITKCLANEEIIEYVHQATSLVFAGEVVYVTTDNGETTSSDAKELIPRITYGYDGRLVQIETFDLYDLRRIFKITDETWDHTEFYVIRNGMCLSVA